MYLIILQTDDRSDVRDNYSVKTIAIQSDLRSDEAVKMLDPATPLSRHLDRSRPVARRYTDYLSFSVIDMGCFWLLWLLFARLPTSQSYPFKTNQTKMKKYYFATYYVHLPRSNLVIMTVWLKKKWGSVCVTFEFFNLHITHAQTCIAFSVQFQA